MIPPPPPPPPVPANVAVPIVPVQNESIERGALLNSIRGGVKLKKCETVEKGLLNGCKNGETGNGLMDSNNNSDGNKDPKMASVQAELLRKLKNRNDGVEEEPVQKQILSPSLRTFVENKTKPLQRDESKVDENAPKMLSHGKRNFAVKKFTSPLAAAPHNTENITPVVKKFGTIERQNNHFNSINNVTTPIYVNTEANHSNDDLSRMSPSSSISTTHSELSSPNSSVPVSDSDEKICCQNGNGKFLKKYNSPVLSDTDDDSVIRVTNNISNMNKNNKYMNKSKTPSPTLVINRQEIQMNHDPLSPKGNVFDVVNKLNGISNTTTEKKFTKTEVTSSQSSFNSSPVSPLENNNWSSSPVPSKKLISPRILKYEEQTKMANFNTLPKRPSQKLNLTHGKRNFEVKKNSENKFATLNPKLMKTAQPTTILTSQDQDLNGISVKEIRKNYNSSVKQNGTLENNISQNGAQINNGTFKSQQTKPNVKSEIKVQLQMEQPKSYDYNAEHNHYQNQNQFNNFSINNKQNGDINVEKRQQQPAIISFTKDLTQYDELESLKQQNPNVEIIKTERIITKELSADDFELKDVKFSIDPHKNDITFDFKINLNLNDK